MLLPPGLSPATEAMFTMRPEPRAFRCGAAARHSRYGPRRLVEKSRSQVVASSVSRSGNGMLTFHAALLTSMSSRPNWPTAASTAAGMAPASVWSSATLHAFRPSASTAAHVSRAASLRSRYVMPTCAPAAASARAIAIPSVPVPPATSATRSLRSMAEPSLPRRSRLEPRIQDVAQPVADQVHGQHGEQDAEARERRDPPRLAEVVASFAQHAAPLRLGRLAPEPEEAERGGGEDRAAQAEGGGDDERRHHVGQDVA